ncbi:MAG: GDP-mannose 4,6-dehydratase [Microbacteriaceae bacterium]
MPADGSAQGTALITGVTGQDGYYLSRLLVESGVAVHGVVGPNENPETVGLPGVTAHAADLTDAGEVCELVDRVSPDYVFHLAGVSSVARSWQEPVLTTEVNAVSTTAVLDACLRLQDSAGRRVAVVNASSGEIFAGAAEARQNEHTPVRPTSPYGVSKALGHMMSHVYRARGLQASNAILFNHESPRRPTTFVTRKITSAVAAIARGEQDSLTLGNIAVQRDWGWAPDYVDAMFRMARHDKGEDFVIASGVAHSIAEFVEAAFAAVGITDWQARVDIDQDLIRPTEIDVMVGDPHRAEAVLGWRRTKSFQGIVSAMVDVDMGHVGTDRGQDG